MRFQKRFLSVDYDATSREKLADLKQAGSVSKYIERFSEIISLWSHPYVDDKRLLDEFIEDLKINIRSLLITNMPNDYCLHLRRLGHLMKVSVRVIVQYHKDPTCSNAREEMQMIWTLTRSV
jgi:FMN phosphatase YigB (HAD superfamily)